jgi:hypothetical protein
MPEDQLRTTIDAIRLRLQQELEAQLASLGERHEHVLDDVRRTAEADAEQRWAARVEAVRAEWVARLESEVGAARAEAERRMVAESMRLRVEAEQAAAESASRVREELEHALTTERQRAVAQIAAERQHLERELAEERQRLADERQRRAEERDRLEAAEAAHRDAQDALERERQARSEDAAKDAQAASALTEARVEERQAQLAAIERLLGAVRSMDSATTLSDILAALLRTAADAAPRAAVFLVNGAELQGWKATGFPDGAAESTRLPLTDTGLLAEATRQREALTAGEGSLLAAPGFAALPPDRAAIAVPIPVGGQVVAVLYADDASRENPEAPAPWPETVQILARHAAACLAHLTAARTAQAMRLVAGGSAAPASGNDDDGSARRYARLLVSEIKLYNEAAVRDGRQHRDLLSRLRPEIERARRLYEERVPHAAGARGTYFQQELVQTLADGDAALLGGQA